MSKDMFAWDDLAPWGFWATIGWGAFLRIIFILIGGLGSQAGFDCAWSVTADHSAANRADLVISMNYLGLIMAGMVMIGLMYLLVARRRDYGMAEYLGFESVPVNQAVLYVMIGIGYVLILTFVILYGAVKYGAGTGGSVVETTGSYLNLGLLMVAIVLMAPIWEEMMFRGFMFTGIRYSMLGNFGAVVLCSFFWAIGHFQYHTINIIAIFFLGCYLGFVRIKTESIYPTIVIHSFNNFIMFFVPIFVLK